TFVLKPAAEPNTAAKNKTRRMLWVGVGIASLIVILGLAIGLPLGLKPTAPAAALENNATPTSSSLIDGPTSNTPLVQTTPSQTATAPGLSPETTGSLITSSAALTKTAESPQPSVGLPSQVGNCKSGTYNFDSSRILYSGYNGGVDPNIDVSKYDFIVTYNGQNLRSSPNGGFETLLTYQGPGVAANGVTVTSTRYMFYGKIS
ncbi:hypothetical protein HDU91_004110, partial [Kappamyces sp. JEL0680]